jgi:hypothetical protein
LLPGSCKNFLTTTTTTTTGVLPLSSTIAGAIAREGSLTSSTGYHHQVRGIHTRPPWATSRVVLRSHISATNWGDEMNLRRRMLDIRNRRVARSGFVLILVYLIIVVSTYQTFVPFSSFWALCNRLATNCDKREKSGCEGGVEW